MSKSAQRKIDEYLAMIEQLRAENQRLLRFIAMHAEEDVEAIIQERDSLQQQVEELRRQCTPEHCYCDPSLEVCIRRPVRVVEVWERKEKDRADRLAMDVQRVIAEGLVMKTERDSLRSQVEDLRKRNDSLAADFNSAAQTNGYLHEQMAHLPASWHEYQMLRSQLERGWDGHTKLLDQLAACRELIGKWRTKRWVDEYTERPSESERRKMCADELQAILDR
jgi:DNA repair exonuclease SbcCD ATPase subunit